MKLSTFFESFLISTHWVKIFAYFLEIEQAQLKNSNYDVLLSTWLVSMNVPSGIYLLKLKSTKKTQEQSVRPQRRIQSPVEHQTKILSNKHEAVCYYHVMYAFQSESTFHSCLNVKGTPRTKQGNIWSLNDELVWPNGWVNQLRKWLNVPLQTKWL